MSKDFTVALKFTFAPNTGWALAHALGIEGRKPTREECRKAIEAVVNKWVDDIETPYYAERFTKCPECLRTLPVEVFEGREDGICNLCIELGIKRGSR